MYEIMYDEPKEQKSFNFQFVRVTMIDLHGIGRGKIYAMKGRNIEKFLKEGVELFCGAAALCADGRIASPSLIQRIVDAGYPNALYVPDVASLRTMPWSGGAAHSVASVFCDSFWISDSSPQEANPRFACTRLLRLFEASGFRVKVGFEAEFQILDGETLLPRFAESDDRLEVIEMTNGLLMDVVAEAQAAGCHIEAMHSEIGLGQFEVVMRARDGIFAVDDVQIFKMALREILEKRGMRASFLSSDGDNYSGFHLNLSLWSMDGKNTNCFYGDSKNKFAKTCQNFLGGLIAHSGALTALCSPTVNCYRRIGAEYAPGWANWGERNRLTSFRLKGNSHSKTLIENRIPSALCNPYLAFAATLAAGFLGLTQAVEPTPEMDKNRKSLPRSLPEAMTMLKTDQDMIDVLGEELVEWWSIVKNEEIEYLTSKFDKEAKGDKEKEIAIEREYYRNC